MKKKISILILIIGILCIGFGTVFSLKPKEEKNKDSLSQEMTKRNYKTVEKIEDNKSLVINKDSLLDISKKIGFSEVVESGCNDRGCGYLNKGYSSSKYKDSINLVWENSDIISLDVGLYYSKKDFSYEKIYKEINSIVRNFIGIDIGLDNIKALPIPKNSEKAENSNFMLGIYTVENSLLYVEDDEMYYYKLFVIKTDKYM